MNERRVESLVGDWLQQQAPAAAPTVVLETVLDRLAGTPQQRRIFGRLARRTLHRASWLPIAIAIALLGAAVLGILAGGGRTEPPAPVSGFIAFVGDSRPPARSPEASGNADILLVRSDGTGLRNLTETPTLNEMAPAWSPDGTAIAFIRLGPGGIGGPSTIVVVDSSSGVEGATAEIADGLWAWSLEWSPDGRYVMVSSLEEGSSTRVTTAAVEATGGHVRTVIRGASSPTRWSPDGSQLLVTTTDLFLVPADLVGEQEIGDPSGLPGVRRLTSDDRGEGYPPPVWAPDGSAVAFASLGDTGMNEPRLDVVDVRNGERSILVDGAFSPAWAPDGRRIAYLKGGPDVWVALADGSAARRIATSFIPPKWSPDGAVLYLLDDGGLYSIRPDGSAIQRLTP